MPVCFFSFTSHRLAFVWQNLLTTPPELPKHTPGRFPGVILPCQRDLREGDNKEIKISCYSPSGLLCCRVHFVLGMVLRFPIGTCCVRRHVKACKVLNIYITTGNMSKHRIRCLKFSREVTRSLKSCGSVFLQTFPLKVEALISGLVCFL